MNVSMPPIVRQAEQLLYDIEQAVRGFPRYSKHSLGADLRRTAMEVAQFAHRAWRERKRASEWTEQLVWKIDQLKISLQLGKRLRAFKSLAQFEALARVAHELGKQAGGWHRQQSRLHPTGQNPSSTATSERAQTLSTRVASTEVNS